MKAYRSDSNLIGHFQGVLIKRGIDTRSVLAQRKGHLAQQEAGIAYKPGKEASRNQLCQYLDLGLAAYRTKSKCRLNHPVCGILL